MSHTNKHSNFVLYFRRMFLCVPSSSAFRSLPVCMPCVCLCVRVRIMACLFVCRLTPVRPLLLISAPASLFRSPPSWLVMKTLLLERQLLLLKASKAQYHYFIGGHNKAFSTSMSKLAAEHQFGM